LQLQKLLQAIETTKTDVRDSFRLAQAEAKLRGELSSLRSERDEALGAATEHKRKACLLEEELRSTKIKLARCASEKIKVERDARAAISLARSRDLQQQSINVDYYKRKVADLTNQVQAESALVAEQRYQIEEMRRQIEASKSQNRLANIRAESSK
jgi:hypothetical protein